MKQLKKGFALLLTVCLLSAILLTPAYAMADEREEEPSRYTGVNFLASDIGINSWGKASCEAAGWVRTGYTAELRICLYRVLDNSIQLVKYWDIGTVSGDFLDGRAYYVVHGTYFSRATLTVHDSNGNYVETVSAATGDYVY